MFAEVLLICIAIAATVTAVWCMWDEYKEWREYRLNNRYLRKRYEERKKDDA